MDLKSFLNKSEGITSISMGAGKSGNRLQRRIAKKSGVSTEINIMLHNADEIGMTEEELRNSIGIRELIDGCWNRADKAFQEIGKFETLRGRAGSIDGSTLYWVYTHSKPKPLLFLSTSYDAAHKAWVAATGQDREGKIGLDADAYDRGAFRKQLESVIATED